MKKIIVPFYLIILSSSIAFGQNLKSSGTSFWFGYMENLNPSINGAPEFSIFLDSDSPTDVTIEIPGKSYKHAISLNGKEGVNYKFPGFGLEPRGSGVTSNLGIHIYSKKPFSAVAVHNRNYFSATTRLLPNSVIGRKYMLIAARDYKYGSPSSMVIVAGIDNTVVDICLNPCGTHGNLTVTLNKGQTYQYQSPYDLSGTKITASNPISVFSGAKQAVLESGDDSHIYFAMPPLYLADTFYVTVPNMALESISYLVLLGTKNKTTAKINSQEITLNEGEKQIIKIAGPTIIKSSEPIFVGQFNSGIGTGVDVGPSMTILNPATSGIKSVSFRTKDDFGQSALKNSFSIITEDTSNVSLNGSKIENFTKIVGSTFFYKIEAINKGTHKINSSSKFTGQVYGSSYAEYYTYSMGFDYTNTSKAKPIYTIGGNECGKWQVLSNPNKGKFSIEVYDSKVKFDEIEIFDARGRLIHQMNWEEDYYDNLTLDVAVGIYYVRIKPCNNTKKVVVLD